LTENLSSTDCNQGLGALGLPVFLAKKEVFDWLLEGKKTVDVRKGRRIEGETVLFISGPRRLTLRVVEVHSGKLGDLVRLDNFRQVIPCAQSLGEALAYFGRFYGDCDGVFTAYTVAR
jgi:ASC-1-like (ASCH) protein